jgi:AraC-like DNA-binding protein
MSIADPHNAQLARQAALLHQYLDDRHGPTHPGTLTVAHALAWILHRRGDHPGAASWYTITADGHHTARHHQLAGRARLSAAWSQFATGRCTAAHQTATEVNDTALARHERSSVVADAVGTRAIMLAGCDRPYPGEAVLVTHEDSLPAPGTTARQRFADTFYRRLLDLASGPPHRAVCTSGAPRAFRLNWHDWPGTGDDIGAFLNRWRALLTGTALPDITLGDSWQTPLVRHHMYRARQIDRLSLLAIARQVGCSRQTVTRILRDADLPTGRPR